MASGAELRLRELNLTLPLLPAPEGNYVRARTIGNNLPI